MNTKTIVTNSPRVSRQNSGGRWAKPGVVLIAALFVAAVCGGVSAQAGTFNWIGSADNNYTNPAAWSVGTVPGIWDTAVIGNATLTNATVYYTNLLSNPQSTNNLYLMEMNTAAGTSTFDMTDGMLLITNGYANPFTNGGSAFTLGNASGATDTFNLGGGTLVVARPSNGTLYYQDAFLMGNVAGSTGTFSISGGEALILCGTEIGNGNPSTGTFSVSGGTVIDNGWFGVGRQNNSVGIFNLSGGTMYILRNPDNDGSGAAGGVSLSQGNPGNSVANISGGTLYCTQIRFNSSGSANQAFNVSGGNIYVGYIGLFRQGGAISQKITISGGTFHTVDMIQVTTGGTGIGDTNSILSDGVNWSWDPNLPVNLTNSSFTVNGMAGPGYVTFAPEATRGITLNSQWSGVGGLVLNGPGALEMGGTNTYTGNTTISQGTLALFGSASIASPYIIVAGGATLDATLSTFSLGAGQVLTNISGTAVVNGLQTGSGTISVTYDGSTPPLTVASGALTLSASTVFNINNTGPALAEGSYKIISSTGGSVGGVLPLVTVTGGGTAGSTPAVLYVHNDELYLAVGVQPPAPQFTLEPASTNLDLFSSDNHLSLTVQASASVADPITYQWFTNGTADTTGGANSTYTSVVATATNFYCVASNVDGTATSEVVSITYVTPPTTPYPSNVLAASPIGYWPLNEPDDGTQGGDGNDGVIAHDYVGGNNGIYTNTDLGGYYFLGTPPPYSLLDTSSTPAAFGATLSDSDAYGIGGINFAAPSNTSVAFSIEAWVNAGTQSADAGIVSKGYGGAEQFLLDTGSDGGSPSHALRFLVRDASGASHAVNSSIQPGNVWHHLVGVCDEANSNVTFYVDGQVAGQAAIAPGGGILASSRAMLIGSRPSTALTNNNLQLAGFVQDVAVYNDALTSNEVAAQYYSSGAPPSFVQLPVQTTNADENGTLVIPAVVTGTAPLAYQWYNGNNNLPLAGQTNATLVISNLAATNNVFYLVATNHFGSTPPAYVSVNVISGAPQIIQDVQSPFFAIEGGTGSDSVLVYGTAPLVYEWQFYTGGNWANLTNGMGISGAQSSILIISNAQTAEAGSYQCVISNSAGSATSSTAQLIVGTQPIGFNVNGGGWTSNQSGNYTTPIVASGVLTLTDGAGNEVRSFFFDYPQYIGAFNASFTYQAGGNRAADGATFCLQNDPRGTAALGSGGGGLGVSGAGGASIPPAIIPSVEVELDLFTSPTGYAYETNGIAGIYTLPGTVSITSGDSINVAIAYANGQMSLTFTDPSTNASFTTNLNVGDITKVLGASTAYVGFTGGDGGSSSVQTITNFTFTSIPPAAIEVRSGAAVISWPGAVTGYGLQQNSDLTTTNWVNVTNAVVLTNGLNEVTLPAGGSNEFYRLLLQ